MGKRYFNSKVYNEVDMSSKIKLIEIIEANSEYKVCDGLNNELYKNGDLIFNKGNKKVVFENEVRFDFDKITQDWNTIHIPIRKRNTPANFYIVWNKPLTQFILINLNKVKKYWDNVILVKCNHEMSQNVDYEEKFIDIPKEETQWYIIGKNNKLQKVKY